MSYAKFRIISAVVFSAVVFVAPAISSAQTTPPSIDSLLAIIQSLQQQIADLQNQLGLLAASSTPPGTPPPSGVGIFQTGDTVITNRVLNARLEPTIHGSILAAVPKGTTGKILEGPVSADGYNWYRVAYEYDIGVTGWSAEIGLQQVRTAGTTGETGTRPVLNSVTPSAIAIGDTTTLVYQGANFQPGAVIVFNGPISGTASAEFVTTNELHQTGTSPLPATTPPGAYSLQVRNPNGETSGIVALVINPAASGASAPAPAPEPSPAPTPTPEPSPAPTPAPTPTPPAAQTGQPTYTLLPTPSNRLVVANGEVLYRFSVSAPANTNAAITQFPFTITPTPGVLVSNVAVYAFTDPNFLQSAYTGDGSSIASWPASLNSTPNVITIPMNSVVGSAVIPAGATYYFELRASVTAVPAGSSVTTALSGLAETTLTNAAPALSAVSPSTFSVGDTITLVYRGTNFQSGAVIVFSGPIGGVASAEFISPNELRQTGTSPVPSSTAPGAYSLQVKNPDGQLSNTVSISIQPQSQSSVAPKITSLTKSSGPVGTTFDIIGSGFSPTNNVFNIKLPTGQVLQATRVASSENGTKFANAGIPDQLGGIRIAPGTVRFSITNQNGTSNEIAFAVTGPVLQSITPSAGPVGTKGDILGSNFTATDNTFHVILPSGASVTVPGVSATNGGTKFPGFTIPATLGTAAVTPGTLRFWITNSFGQSNDLTFTVIAIRSSAGNSKQGLASALAGIANALESIKKILLGLRK